MYFGLFIISMQTTNYANGNGKATHSADFKWPFPSSFKHLLCPLCIFDKSSEATGYALLSVISQQEMNGYWELYPGLWYPVSSEDDYRAGRGEQQRKIGFRVSSENSSATLTSDIWNKAVSVYIRTKYPLNIFPRTCH